MLDRGNHQHNSRCAATDDLAPRCAPKRKDFRAPHTCHYSWHDKPRVTLEKNCHIEFDIRLIGQVHPGFDCSGDAFHMVVQGHLSVDAGDDGKVVEGSLVITTPTPGDPKGPSRERNR